MALSILENEMKGRGTTTKKRNKQED